jgi:hypothetical protein
MPKGENNKKLSDNDIRKIVEMYTTRNIDGTWTGSTLIAERFNVHRNCVLYHLKRQGVKIRSTKEAHSGGKACRPIKNLPPPNESPPSCKCGCGLLVEWHQHKNRWRKFVVGHFHGHRPYHDLDLLHQEYVVKKRTIGDIALDFNVSITTISRWLRHHQIEIRSQSENLKLFGKMRGANNPAWKGGVADWAYSHDWKSVCKTIKDRDLWTCQLCGETRKHWGNRLHVHHIDENKLNNHPHNLITLCANCHAKSHGNEQARQVLSACAVSNCKSSKNAPHPI